jgi:hypothetical protein
MQLTHIKEPLLDFNLQQHEDIRFGIMNYLPFDVDSEKRPSRIKVGIIGTAKTINGCIEWMSKCQLEIPAKESPLKNLFVRFPGYRSETCFKSSINIEDRNKRTISERDIQKITVCNDRNIVVENAVSLYLDSIKYLADESNVDVVICSVPEEILAFRTMEIPDDGGGEEPPDNIRYDFHHMLKARAMAFRIPIQLVIPSTYGEKIKLKDELLRRTPQDEATRAWNFFTALYYKANGTPWRLPRISSELPTCYLGVSFYRNLDEKSVNTSIAQIFNELGDGIIIRGAQAQTTKEDRQPHLNATDAEKLIDDALLRYRKEHKTLPARIVLHKSSHFSDGEKEGFISGIDKHGVSEYDFMSIRSSETRLYRIGSYPPLRGMLWDLDELNHVMYTRGSVYFYETYPGMYIPHPILFKTESSERPFYELAKEILALTKMNWNSTQFDHALPITMCAAKRVGDVLKYLPQDIELCPRYSYYM